MSGSLTADQTKWLAGLVKPAGGGPGDVAAQSDTARTRRDTRRDVLDGVLRAVGAIEGRLADAMGQYKLLTADGQTVQLLTGAGDPDAEIDTRHDVRAGSAMVNPDAIKAIQPLYEVLIGQSAVLRDARAAPDGTPADDGAGDPLFTEADIADEIWTPLVRAGVLPENLVQKRYSDVAKLFAGAQAEYGRRLAAFSEQAEAESSLADSLGLAADAMSSLGTIADGLAAGVLHATGAAEGTKKTIKDGIAVIAAVGSGGLTVAQSVVAGVDGPALLKAAIFGAKQAVGVADLAGATKAILGKAIDAAVHAGSFVQSILKGEVQAASGSLADAVAGGLDALGQYYDDPAYAQLGGHLKGSIKTLAAAKKVQSLVATGGADLVDAVSDLVKQAGDLAVHAIKSNIENQARLALETQQQAVTDELDAKLREAQRSLEALTGACFAVSKLQDDVDAIVQSAQMQAVLQANTALAAKWRELLCAAAKGVNPAPLGREIEALLTGLQTKQAALEQLRLEVAAGVAKAKEEREALEEGEEDEEEDEDEEDEEGEDDASDTVKEIMAQLAAAEAVSQPADALVAGVEAQARLQKVQADAAAFGIALRNDFTAAMNETDDGVRQARLAVSKLAPVIEGLKRDKAYLTLADTLVTVGVTVGKTMFEQIGPLGSFKACATSVYGAIGHMQELGRWEDSMRDSRNAGASALVAAEFNRAGLEARFRSADWINAAVKAVEAVGSALKVTGVAAPLGTALEGAAKVGGEGAKLVTKFYDAATLKKAWTDYQLAMQDPEDRKAVRQALRSNPTLAKYALAWAAVVAHDPLARDAMRQTGLSDAVLADKDTSATAVVEYLEAVYDTDPVVLKATPPREDWWPGAPALSSRNWVKFLKAAEDTDAGLQGESAILVTQLLVRMEKRVPADFPAPVDAASVTAARSALDELIDALAAYDPRETEGDRHDGMRRYAAAMRALAELRRRRLPPSPVVAA